MTPNENPNDKKPPIKQNPILLFIVFAIVAMLIIKFTSSDSSGMFSGGFSGGSTKNIEYYELKQLIASKQVSSVSIGQTIIKANGIDMNGRAVTYIARKVADTSLVPLLEENKITYGGFSESNFFTDMLGWLLPIFVFLGLWMFLANRMQKNMGGGIFGMGSSKKLVNAEKPKVKFDDMAGNEEAKEEVVEIVDFQIGRAHV